MDFIIVCIGLTKKYPFTIIKYEVIVVEKGVWAKWNELYIMQVKKW